jgi:hypothetical protein
VIYSSLVYQSIGKTAGERVKLERTIADLKAKVLEIKAAGDKDVSFLDRFFVDIENKLLRSRDKETQAKETIFAAEKSFRTKVDDYQNAIAEVQGSYLYLKDIASYLQEVLRLIKTK